MSGEKLPSGRDRAIETLIDLEPNGACYRASRILDEVAPHAQCSRPNLITRAALIEQAHALAEYEVDSFEKYKDVFALTGLEQPDHNESKFPEETVQRVLRHHDKILASKSQKNTATPPCQLVASLKRLFGSDLLKNVFRHTAFDADEPNDRKAEGNLEAIIGNVCRDFNDGNKKDDLHGLLLATLSVLTGSDHDGLEVPDLSEGKSESRAELAERHQDPRDIPPLQVGAIMSLLETDVEKGPFSLDDKILTYLGRAASAYEERIEIQKARLLAKMEEKEAFDVNIDSKRVDAPAETTGEGNDDMPLPVVPLSDPVGSEPRAVVVDDDHEPNSEEQEENEQADDHDPEDDEEDDANEDEDDDDDDDDLGINGLSPTVFNQIISAVAGGDDMSLDGVDRAALRLAAGGLGADSSDSDSTNDNDSDHHLDRYAREQGARLVDPDDESSASEDEDNEPSPEIVDDEEDDNDGGDDDDDDEDENEGNSDSILRRALALSLSDHTGFADAAESNRQDDQGPENKDEHGIGLATTKSEFSDSKRSTFEGPDACSLDSQSPLPELPSPPSLYPYWCSVESVADVDGKNDPADNLHPCLDPSSLARFGSIPTSLALVRLLQNSLASVASHSASEEKRKLTKRTEFRFKSSVPGGMGCKLFGSEAHLSEGNVSDSTDAIGRSSVAVQLLVAAVILFFESRRNAIRGLREAILAEQRNAQGDDEEEIDDDDNVDGNDTPLSDDEEEDINSVPLAMRLNYPTGGSNLAASLRSPSSQAESLESKGMTRKAAAAGWDAAMRIKSLKKNTDAWKNRVKLYSYCTLLALKSFRTYFQFCVSDRLDRIGVLAENNAAFPSKNLKKIVPTSVNEKLEIVLSTLLSVSEFRSLPTLVSGDDDDEIEELLMPLKLYREALVTWGECIPLLHSAASDREVLLRNLVKDCFSKALTVQHFGSFETLLSLPTSEDESQLYKLDILCRRFCVTDLLDDVLPRPLCFSSGGSDEMEVVQGDDDDEPPSVASSLVKLLYFASLKTNGTCLRFLRRLSMAVCHRYIVRGILWDGLYAYSHFEADEISSSPASTALVESLRVNGNPSSSLQFDSTKCSDSIAILPNNPSSPASSNGPSAHQRASKVWGTVISSAFYNPKSGVHRWAVRLDRCERGHVFVGVATAQANMRTYVGGDKYGWGVIGTQALWHDRRKIRGDYGGTFRTGSIIVVTLDTDAGTLSFSTWKESNSGTGSFSIDPLSQTHSSPRRQSNAGGTLEDWGIAFEGLPLDAKLYPAVGLYQRDDRVTLLNVESGGRPGEQSVNADSELFIGGTEYFPRPGQLKSIHSGVHGKVSKIQAHNGALSWGSIEFVESILSNAIESIMSGDKERILSVHATLLSVAAAICLLPPSIPVLSNRLALHILPRLTECINCLDKVIRSQHSLFSGMIKEGKWVIRATGTPGLGVHEFEEYIVNFTNKIADDGRVVGFFGTGIGTTGKSKNGLVSIIGTVYGSSIHFVEEWTDGVDAIDSSSITEESSSSCVVAARLSLDAFKFEGTYRNVQYGTTGHIAALCLADRGVVDNTDLSGANYTLRCQGLLRLAHGHLAMILSHDVAGDQSVRSEIQGPEGRKLRMLSFLEFAPFCEGFLDSDGTIMDKKLDSLRELYSGQGRPVGLLASEAFAVPQIARNAIDSISLFSEVSKLDEELAPKNGGKGSLYSLCPEMYTEARLVVIVALVHHCCLVEDVVDGKCHGLDSIWSTALTIVENQIRTALSDSGLKELTMREKSVSTCRRIVFVSKFLLSLQPTTEHPVNKEEISSCISQFLSAVKENDDLKVFDDEFAASMGRACLRFAALKQINNILPSIEANLDLAKATAIECTSVAIPRLLGRGLSVNKAVLSLYPPGRMMETGNHYLTYLSGAGLSLRNCVRFSVHSIVANLGQVLRQINDTSSNADHESSLLSILPVFASSMLPSDIEHFALQSKILDSLFLILSNRRSALRTAHSGELSCKETDRFLLVAEMKDIVQRDVARSVVQTGLSVFHAITYQASHWAQQGAGDHHRDTARDVVRDCVRLLLREFQEAVPFIETIKRDELDLYLNVQGDDQYNSWARASIPMSSGNEKTKRKEPHIRHWRSSLSHLLEKGTSVAIGGTPTKAGSKNSPSAKPLLPRGSHYENLTSSTGNGFASDLYLARLLDVFNCVVRSSVALSALAQLGQSMDPLFAAIGFSIQSVESVSLFDVVVRNDSSIPAHYRARIIRFLPRLLSLATADEHVVEGLFKITGQANGILVNSLYGDESLVGSEAIACLRSIYSPSCSDWRRTINKVIATNAYSRDKIASNDILTLGILAFVGGSIRALGPGSTILLKPAAAAPLAPDAQSTPNTKSVTGSASSGVTGGVTSHHIVGTGTEGIIAGLCRSEAAAGIVTSVDTKAAMCEVILVERNSETRQFISSSTTRNTLTVRALRSPLSDIALAEQIPLQLDANFPVLTFLEATLPNALAFFAHPPQPDGAALSIQDQLNRVGPAQNSILSIRAAIVLLSDERLLNEYISHKGSRESFSELLRLADKEKDFMSRIRDTGSIDSLASLPVHEGKYLHFVRMLAELQVRQSILEMTLEDSWSRRADEACVFQTKSESEKIEEKTGPNAGAAMASTAAGESETLRDDTAPSTTTRGDVTSSRRTTSHSSVSSISTEDEDESEAAGTAAAHLREAAIAQMLELGLPRSWSELALRRTGVTNIEAAVHFCLERGGDMERLLAEERERERMMQRSTTGSSRRRSSRTERSNQLLRQLLEMGFPNRWCAAALEATQNNVDEALTWILTNGDRLSAEDVGMEEDDEDENFVEEEEDDEEDDDQPQQDGEGDPEGSEQPTEDNQEFTLDAAARGITEMDAVALDVAEPSGWCGSVTPIRFISGRSIINPKTLSISGLPSGGFSSVGTKGVLLTAGKWYYEAILETAGCLQIGWADGSFSGHCHAERGDGCGDGPSSWAFDGWRRYRWHSSATEWGCRWKEGDVIGCLVDMDEKIVSFMLNGKGEEVGMGVAFSGQGFRPCGGVYACVSFNRKEKLRLILGGKGTEPFKFNPPSGYIGVGEAVLAAVQERENLVAKEAILGSDDGGGETESENRFLCDFSDGEHGHELFAWQHRYYGSDASVHLGSGRSAKPSVNTKSSTSNGLNIESSPLACVSQRVEKKWSTKLSSQTKDLSDTTLLKSEMSASLRSVAYDVAQDALHEGFLVGILFARKLVLHLIVTLGNDFDLSHFDDNGQAEAARSFWRVIDSCVSLRSAGWVGEAGAMAIAAEALGLGISSTEHQSRTLDRPGLLTVDCGEDPTVLPVAGISQLLNTITIGKNVEGDGCRETWRTLAGCAEASFGADGGGGPLVFLQRGLQSALYRSESLRAVLVAIIRRSVRLLAVVDYSGTDSSSSTSPEDDSLDTSGPTAKRPNDAAQEETAKAQQPDARLACFLSGLLLSNPVQCRVADKEKLFGDLLEAWSVGLLSASAPWRMVCSFTAAGIINKSPSALSQVMRSSPTVSNFYQRLQNTVLRRVWAERAAVPVCSRYVQALVELLASLRLAKPTASGLKWNQLEVDAATPLPLDAAPCDGQMIKAGLSPSWEWDEGWVACDAGWETWVGSVECMAADWEAPSRSAVRNLMDGGEGPPMLREGCVVMRGLDWENAGSCGNSDADGKLKYEAEKAEREKEKKAMEEQAADDPAESEHESCDFSNDGQPDPATADDNNSRRLTPMSSDTKEKSDSNKKKKRRRLANPKLPTGTVISVEPWNGVPAMARKVRWHLTGEEGIYRYGADGGRFDICHVEVNEKATRIRKRHPFPESAEQCAARHGFGSAKKYCVLLRLRRVGVPRTTENNETEWDHEGVLEWPDFGAGVRVNCILYSDGAVLLQEKDLLFGSKDSGWEARFGQPSYISGTEILLSPTGISTRKDMAEADAKSSFMSVYQELLGSTSYVVNGLRHRANGTKVRVTMEMTLLRGRRPEKSITLPLCLEYTPRPPPPMCFDRDYHAPSMSLSRDGVTLTCVSPDGRGTAFASVGFTKGVHYWEVKLEQADVGSVFIGVAEKPTTGTSGGGSSFGNDGPPRLNRWLGWGFVNFRATYTAGAERVYGAHCHNEDTVGVLLDCDAGRVSFFYDGMKYGEHILNDLGCAFENVSPFGFNADGCGSGGAGQGAPSGIEGGRGGRYPAHGVVRPRALWPVVGLRNPGDRVTLSRKWLTSGGVEPSSVLKNVLAVDELISGYCSNWTGPNGMQSLTFPSWFIHEAFDEYRRWHSRRWYRTTTRCSGSSRLATFGLDIELDSSPLACAAACAAIGLGYVLLAGDRVVVKRSAGRPLELAEEAVVLGAHQSCLYYRLVSQKSEGGSLTEGGGRAWFWDESEVVDDSLQVVGKGKGHGVALPLIDHFRCMSSGGIKIVYEGGAVVRSDLEIFDRSSNLGTIPRDTVIPRSDVLERRVNSCGVIRYRVRYEGIGEGWISSRIRGGKEESIVEPVHDSSKDDELEHECSFRTPEEAAIAWYDQFLHISPQARDEELSMKLFDIANLEEFHKLASDGVIPGVSLQESDSVVARLVSTIADFSEDGDALDSSFSKVASAVSYALASSGGQTVPDEVVSMPGANESAASVLTSASGQFTSGKALMARIALIRAFNRRVSKALPWLSVRPSQEGTAILGGVCGQGASVERAGHGRLVDSMDLWVQVPSIASRVRSVKGLIFSSVKLEFLDSVTQATATPTPLSHDEYELPREIRTVRVNRLKARRAMAGNDPRLKRKYSVFAQLQNETRSWGGAALRRSFVAKGHGGQKRAFKVKLVGEGVNDYSGPYREVFTDAVHEVLQFDDDGKGSLGVLDPTPNNANQIGDDRELFMFSRGERALLRDHEVKDGVSGEEIRICKSFTSLTMTRDESSREVEESLVFLGRLTGTACRHGIPVDLPLPMMMVWNAIVEENVSATNVLREIDLLASKNLDAGDAGPLLAWEQRMLNAFVDGLSHLLPVELLPLLSGEELRSLMCGNPDVDVDLLKRVVEYEGYKESDAVIGYFWEALREMSNEDRKRFLQFVWARNRLPNKESDFEAPFKIQKDSGGSDSSLPSASTCFFTLTLPEYSSKDILREKLTFAVENVCTMESDYVTNDAEVGEGWRGV